MADFISALTGVQMDQALLDMAEHNSEAYAVGERNGIAVASDDVTYHNNARYYAQIASSQIVGDASSAVRWDTDQSEALTDAQKAQARENIGATAFNDNLLDNPWFTVRQRGNGAFSAPNYTADRWKLTAGSAQLSFNDNGGVITPNGSYLLLTQYTRIPSTIGTVTASIKISGTVYSVTGSAATGFQLSLADVWGSGRIEVAASGGYLNFIIGASTAATFEAAKLELGSISTLANDAPPEYGEELTRCIYSRADTSDTYANNGFGRTNPNLLDNWDFYNPVNQRGLTTYNSSSSAFYTIDRWYLNNGSGANYLAVMGGYIRLHSASNGLVQFIDAQKAAELNGKIITLSVKFADGTISSWTTKFSTSSSDHIGISKGCILYQGYLGSKYVLFDLLTASNDYVDIVAVKAELGSVSTLANDAPPEVSTELQKCRYRYVPISLNQYSSLGWGFMSSGTTAEITIPLSSPFALDGNTPTISITNSGNLKVGDAAGTNAVTPTSWSIRKRTATTVTIEFAIPSGYYSANTGVYLRSVGDATVAISADL